MEKDVPCPVQVEGFELRYEDFGRTGAEIMVHELTSTDVFDAAEEAVAFLSAKPRLPAQNTVTIVKRFTLDVSEFELEIPRDKRTGDKEAEST